MNKIFSSLAILSFALAFSSCSKEEDLLFDQSAAERLNAASDLYSARLEAQPNGWAMQLYPTTDDEAPYGSGYLLLLRFNKDHSVVASMNNVFTGNTYLTDESHWSVNTDNGPVLSFDTYNFNIHAFSDPEDVLSTGTADEPNDETGTGIGGDYEFVIVQAPEDASFMMLKGKKRGTYNLLTPVEEGVDYESYLADVNAFHNRMFSKSSPSFDVLHYGDSLFVFKGADDGIPTIYPYDGDEVTESSFNPFLITKRGNDYYLRFRDAKTYGNVSVQDFKYDTQKDMFVSVDNSAFYLDGDSPSRFFEQTLSSDGNAWTCKSDAVMSESFAQLYANLKAAFANVKYTLQSVALRTTTGKLILRVTYKTSKSTSNVDYIYESSTNGDNVTLTYKGADKAAGENILKQLPDMQTMIDTFNQTFTVSAADTKFNLSTIKLTSTKDSGLWFVLTK